MIEERKLLRIIDSLSVKSLGISDWDIEERASMEGIENPRIVLESLIAQGLVIREAGQISKIKKIL